MRISDWSSDMCSSDLFRRKLALLMHRFQDCRAPRFQFAHIKQPDLKVAQQRVIQAAGGFRSEEHTSELQSLMRISYAVFCLKKKKKQRTQRTSQKNNREYIKRCHYPIALCTDKTTTRER